MTIKLGIVQEKEAETPTSPKRQISPTKERNTRTFLKMMTATQSDYEQHLQLYMIKKHDFIDYVLC